MQGSDLPHRDGSGVLTLTNPYPRHSMGLPYMPTLGIFEGSMGRQSYGSPISRVWVWFGEGGPVGLFSWSTPEPGRST